MNRNKNVDILRVVAILIIIVYHSYVLCGTPWVARDTIHTLISFGGEIGVTLFLVLSGYGIFMSLWRKETSGSFPSWRSFMKSRCKRIMPQYYFCIGFLLIFQSAYLLSRTGLKHIIAYATFTQNLTIETHGSINGALWTMATIFQFYLVAIWLYKIVRKNQLISMLGSAVITIASKWIIYNFMIPALALEATAYFVYGRQLISALDNFVFGMIAAQIIINWQKKSIKKNTYIGIVSTLFTLGAMVCVSYYLSKHGLYGCYINGYIGHTVIAGLCAGLVLSVSLLPQIGGCAGKVIQFLAKNQYGIYLWHMPIIVSLYNSSELFQYFAHTNFIVYAVLIITVSILIGWGTGRISLSKS